MADAGGPHEIPNGDDDGDVDDDEYAVPDLDPGFRLMREAAWFLSVDLHELAEHHGREPLPDGFEFLPSELQTSLDPRVLTRLAIIAENFARSLRLGLPIDGDETLGTQLVIHMMYQQALEILREGVDGFELYGEAETIPELSEDDWNEQVRILRERWAEQSDVDFLYWDDDFQLHSRPITIETLAQPGKDFTWDLEP